MDGQFETIGMPEYLKDQIIVKFKDDISSKDKKDVKKLYKLMDKAKFASGGEVLKLKGKMTVEELVDKLGMLDSVEYAGFDYIMRAEELPEVTDPRLSELWGMDKIDADGDPGAWEIDQGNPEVIVAVIDTGVNLDHPDLVSNIWVNSMEIPGDGIDNDGNGYTDDIQGYDFYNNDSNPSDDQGHGTHCAGTIAAEANDIGVVGVAPNVKIMPLKFLNSEGSGSFSDAILAIDYAEDMGAHVISASWGGYSIVMDENEVYDDPMYIAINNFSGLFVAAAGNESVNTDTHSYLGLGLYPYYHLPSRYPNENIVAVASIDTDGDMSSFSNYGPETVDLVSPGRNILSTVLSDGYGTKSGTSMATPHVAGVVALMISHEINVNGYGPYSIERRGKLELRDDLFAATVYDYRYFGMVKTGGCLNAYNALLLTPGYGVEPPPLDNLPPEPVFEESPEIIGTVQVGTELSADSGGWTDENVASLMYSYLWQISSEGNEFDIDNASVGDTYTPVTSDGNSYVRIVVTAEDNGGLTNTADSDWYLIGEEPPPNEAPVNIAPPVISGSFVVYGSITAGHGTWEDEGVLEYYCTWQVSADQTSPFEEWEDPSWTIGLTPTFFPEPDQAEKYIRIEVVVEDTEGLTGVAYSNWEQIGPVNGTPSNETLPEIDGIVQVDENLTAIPGLWSDDGGEENLTYGYEWQISEEKTVIDKKVSGTYYTPIADDAGSYIRIAETATDDGVYIDKSDTAYSEWQIITPVPLPPNEAPVNKIPPTIDGILQVGSTLTAMVGTWEDEDITDGNSETNLTFSYVWQVWINKNRTIDKGFAETYIPSETDENKQIRVIVTATDSGGLTSMASSAWGEILPAGSDLPPEEEFTVSIDSPASGARNVPVNEVIVLSFSEAVDTGTVNIEALSLTSRTDTIVLTEDDIDFSTDGLKGRIYADYNKKTKYTLTVNTDFVKNGEGEYLTDKFVTSFTTVR